MNARLKLGKEKALELASAAEHIIVAKGKKRVDFSMQEEPPDEETLLSHMLGRTGNLRAPTLVLGETLVVGFNQALYESLFE
ncbi:MAG TPA: hypothetical protein DCE42_30970 [Myxococcales bacterium]|nr:hypothetical protein [Deltaproteobacteria bacterium]HAA59211.1 hypothetical protein [Myxococcales bacterium]